MTAESIRSEVVQTYATFAEQVSACRWRLGLTYKSFANLLGVKPKTIENIEKGALDVDVLSLFRIMDQLGLDQIPSLDGPRRDSTSATNAEFLEYIGILKHTCSQMSWRKRYLQLLRARMTEKRLAVAAARKSSYDQRMRRSEFKKGVKSRSTAL
ncbi:MAG: hypothetical protein C5B53_11370 [Candidatus Melainabacteria bacterium]|nr:MAG: hypothetical protein C5B53_11370 [Candidatus Melainabacteria bacterium]